MGGDRERYEKSIVQSTLFTLDKVADETAYKRESLKMVEYLYCYLLSINKYKYKPYGYEITVVATRCINGFSAKKGEFLNYFNSAWKQEYSHICGEQVIESKFEGLHINEEDKRNIRKYLKYSKAVGISFSDEELYTKISEIMGMPVESIYEIAEMSQTCVVNSYQIDGDGKELSLVDRISDDCTTERMVEDAESVTETLEKIESVFLRLQERQRPIIAEVITARIAETLVDLSCQLHHFSFIDINVLIDYKATGYLPTQRDIAQKYNRNEASISRTVKEFVNKLNERT